MEHGPVVGKALARVRERAVEGIVRSAHTSRADRELLQRTGWLHRIIRGWFVLGLQPEPTSGPSLEGATALWYGSFWPFVACYLRERFGDRYCLSAECSLDLHTGATVVPRQLVVISASGGANTLSLPLDTSLLSYPDPDNLPSEVEIHNGVRVMPLARALCRVSPRFFRSDPVSAELALRLVTPFELSRALLEGRHTRAGGRLAGAYAFLNEPARSARIREDIAAAGFRSEVTNPFVTRSGVLGSSRLRSPHAGRIEAMWQSMRNDVIDVWPPPPGVPTDKDSYLVLLEEVFQHDAYNSLSIEGYQVTAELIEKIRSGEWDPTASHQDREQAAALAAKGYREAFDAVKRCVAKVLDGTDATDLLEAGLQDWYRALFSPSVQAGIIQAGDLAGYRSSPVFIRGSSHVPPAREAVLNCIDSLLGLLRGEQEPCVQAVLGHFVFVFIHPYSDGNGRIARFLMNLMLAAGGCPWTVVRNEKRDEYLRSLEQASVGGKIGPFASFIRQEMEVDRRP